MISRILSSLFVLPVIFFVGCSGVEHGVEVQKGGVLENAKGIEKGGIEIKQEAPLLELQRDAASIKLYPKAINVQTAPKTVCIEPGAITTAPKTVCVEAGALTFQKGSVEINLNLYPKPPQIEKPEIKGIRSVTDEDIIKKITDKKLAEDILNNETIYKAIITTLLKRIDIYNETYAKEDTQANSKAETVNIEQKK